MTNMPKMSSRAKKAIEATVPANTYRGIIIHGDDEDGVTIEWHGEACDFNTIEDARDWIDEELDTDWGFDDVAKAREWGTAQR